MTGPLDKLIYKITTDALWRRAEAGGVLPPSPVDVTDGFMHFSSRAQLDQTAILHFAGQTSLVIAVIDVARLGAALRWEPSRGGALFPHLYAPLPRTAIVWAAPLAIPAAPPVIWPEDMP